MLHKAAADRVALSEGDAIGCSDGMSIRVATNGEAPSVSALVAAAYTLDCRTVYILAQPRADGSPFGTADKTPPGGLRLFGSGPAGGPDTTWTVEDPAHGGDPVVLMALAGDSRWDMLHHLPGERLLRAASYLRAAAGLWPRYSPGHMARVLIDQTVSNPLWLRPIAAALPRLRTMDLAWVGGLPPEARGVHAYDVNAAYLAVAADQDLGVGEPEPLPADADPAHVSGYAFFQVRAHPAGSRWNGGLHPSPFGTHPARAGRAAGVVTGWWAAPHVVLALELGWQVDIRGGLVWPERHRVLRYWAKRLWDARAELADTERYPDRLCAAAAVQIVKRIYSQGIALLGRLPTPATDDAPGPGGLLRRAARRRFYRPDWRAWIMAECYRRRVVAIARYDPAAGVPVAARTDMVVIASRDGQARTGGVLERPAGLGGYRPVWSVTDADGVERLARLAENRSVSVQRFLALARKEVRR